MFDDPRHDFAAGVIFVVGTLILYARLSSLERLGGSTTVGWGIAWLYESFGKGCVLGIGLFLALIFLVVGSIRLWNDYKRRSK